MEDNNIQDPSNVVSFPDLKAMVDEMEPLTRVSRHSQPFCRHSRRDVSPEQRKVWCRDCEAELDPITVLGDIAHEFSGWKAKKMKEELARLYALERKIEANVKRPELRTLEELACTTWMEFRALHKCNPEKMWRKGDMIHCYCGSAFNRHSFPMQALKVFEAHKRIATKAGFELKKWPERAV